MRCVTKMVVGKIVVDEDVCEMCCVMDKDVCEMCDKDGGGQRYVCVCAMCCVKDDV